VVVIEVVVEQEVEVEVMWVTLVVEHEVEIEVVMDEVVCMM